MPSGKRSSALTVAATLMAGTTGIPVYAQVTPAAQEATDNSIPDIIVTAQKRAQSINDVGLTITALGTDTLEKQGIKTLNDLANSVPGLSYAGTDFGSPIFTLRGVGFYDRALAGYPTTSVYVDEIPLPFPNLAVHTNMDLERVEVLKGPQGTLFGQNSTGGAINFIAAKPTDTLAAGVDGTIGRFGAGEANGFISGPISDTVGVRIAAQYGYGSPWQRSFTRDDSLGRKNYINGRMLLHWAPTANLKIALNLNAWRDTSDPQAGQYITTFPQINSPGGAAVHPALRTYPFTPANARAADWSTDHRPSALKKQWQASLRGDLDLTDDIVLTSISSYVDYKVRQTLDIDSVSIQDFEYVESGKIKSFTQELRLTGGEGTPFRWVLGGNFEKSKVFERTEQVYGDSTVARVLGFKSGGNFTDNKMTNYALFANGEYDITPELTFKAGARYTNSKVDGHLCTYDTGDGLTAAFMTNLARLLNPGVTIPALKVGECTTLLQNNLPGAVFDVIKEDSISWRVGLDYKPSRDLLLYANVSRGYKAGSFPIAGASRFTTYLPVTQEELTDYEAGFKAKLFDRRVGLNGAVFYYDYRNKQLLSRRRDPIVGNVTALVNIPKSRVKGAELELTASPLEGLRMNAGATYLDAKITEYSGTNAGGVIANFAGTRMPFTPKWQFLASADYNLPVNGPVRPFIGATLTKRTKTTSIVGSGSGALTLPGFRSLVPLSEIYTIPGYATLDLRAGIEAEDGSWRLMVWGKNVTNKYYWQNIVTVYDTVARYSGPPATYGITAAFKFQ